jgi:tRNA-dihydrouridine synthase A
VSGDGCFGAALMKNPKLVAEIMGAINGAVTIPTSVKCRIGVDDLDSYELLHEFINTVSNAPNGGVKHFIIHARKALLNGLSPAQNRSIPPLKYDVVYRLESISSFLSLSSVE